MADPFPWRRGWGVMGDARPYEDILGQHAVTSTDGMIADVFEFP